MTLDHTLVGVSCGSANEAHFICALLNSVPANFVVRGYVTLHPSPAILKYIRIARFNAKIALHQALASNSQLLHQAKVLGDAAKLQTLEANNLELAAAYWDLQQSDVADLKESLQDLRRAQGRRLDRTRSR